MHCNGPAHSPLRRDHRPSYGRAPLGSSRSPARVYRVRSGPARLLKTTCSSQGSTLPLRGRPASQVHRSRTGSACNIHAISPLRRVLRSSIGRPRSGVQVTSLGSSVPLRPGPPASSNALSQGSTPRSRGRPAHSGSSAPHRVGLPSLLSAAPGSTVLNRPAPLGSLGCLLGFIGPTLGPARLLK
jgi:hypothetical protein